LISAGLSAKTRVNMKIWINRAGQNLGTLDVEEVQRGLDSGQYLPTDLGWREGMENWRPLSEFPELRMPQAPVVQRPVPGTPQAAPQQAVAVVEGAETAPSWERRQTLGFRKALFETWREVLFNPTATFQRLKTSGEYRSPLLFQAVMTTLLFAVTAIYQIFWVGLIGAAGMMSDTQRHGMAAGPGIAGMFLMFVIAAIVGIPLAIGMNFVHAAVLHFCLMLMKGTSKNYEATYRITSYCASGLIFALIPFVGTSIGAIWSLICEVIGLREVHKTENWRAILAVLLPIIVCCVLAMLLYGSIFAALMSSARHMNSSN
jgi:hypothetical protein